MRINHDQLASKLSQKLGPLYVITGDEPLAQMESLDALRTTARKLGFEERLSFTVERGFNWQQLTASGQEMSLFATRRIVEVHIASGKPGTDGSKALQGYAARLPDDTLTIITLPKLDKQGQASTWFSALEKAGDVVMLNDVDIDRLPQWIANRLKTQSQHTDSNTLAFMASQIEGNLLAAHQEIQKLGLLYPAGQLSEANVRDAIFNVSRFDAFQLGDAMMTGDIARTARILDGLEAEGTQPIALLGMLTWSLRGVFKVKRAEAMGENIASAMQEAKIWGDRQVMVRKMLSRVSLGQLQAAMVKLAEIDRLAKGLGVGTPWLEISRLCIGLAKTRART